MHIADSFRPKWRHSGPALREAVDVRSRNLSAVIVTISILMTTSCAANSPTTEEAYFNFAFESARPPDEALVEIVGGQNFPGGPMMMPYVLAVDGKTVDVEGKSLRSETIIGDMQEKIKHPIQSSYFKFRYQIRLRPGSHQIEINFMSRNASAIFQGGSNDDKILRVNAEAGKKYYVIHGACSSTKTWEATIFVNDPASNERNQRDWLDNWRKRCPG